MKQIVPRKDDADIYDTRNDYSEGCDRLEHYAQTFAWFAWASWKTGHVWNVWEVPGDLQRENYETEVLDEYTTDERG